MSSEDDEDKYLQYRIRFTYSYFRGGVELICHYTILVRAKVMLAVTGCRMSDVLPQQLKSKRLVNLRVSAPILPHKCMLASCVLFTFLEKLRSLMCGNSMSGSGVSAAPEQESR